MKAHLYLILIVVLGFSNTIKAQPGPPGGGGNPPCWPPSPTCPPDEPIPLNNELVILLLGGLTYGGYFIVKNKDFEVRT